MRENTHVDKAGLRAELATLSTEAVNESLAEMDTMSTAELVTAMNEQDALVAAAVAAASVPIAAAIDAVSDRLAAGGRLIYLGAGTPGRLGILDASECPPTFGTDPSQVVGIIAGGTAAIQNAIEGAEDDVDAPRTELDRLNLSAKDAVVGISASGRTPFVVSGLAHAAAIGALTVALACNDRSPIGAAADIAIEIPVGPEFLTGSTRLKAATAQKMVLNMISTISMVRLGKTYGNVMVDLQYTNKKLRVRAESTVMRVAQVSAEEASDALDAVGGSVKEAILVLKTGLTPDAARALLVEHGGFLRAAIDAASRTP